MLGTPWFWRIYIGFLFVAAFAMGAKHLELPRAIGGPATVVLMGLQGVQLGSSYQAQGFGKHSKKCPPST